MKYLLVIVSIFLLSGCLDSHRNTTIECFDEFRTINIDTNINVSCKEPNFTVVCKKGTEINNGNRFYCSDSQKKEFWFIDSEPEFCEKDLGEGGVPILYDKGEYYESSQCGCDGNNGYILNIEKKRCEKTL